MTRPKVKWLILPVVMIGVGVWIARHTYWDSMTVPLPATGEAATDPFYALEKFAQTLGAHAYWDRGARLPPNTAVLFLSDWNWDLSRERRQRIERWVTSGGRLVVDSSLISGTDSLERWSGIGQKSLPQPPGEQRRGPGSLCYTMQEEGWTNGSYTICGMSGSSSLTTSRRINWALRAQKPGIQAMRVRIGAGSVTVLNGRPFVERGLFDDDNGILFVAAAQLRRGDDIHFVSEARSPSLLGLAWEFGWPAICILALVLALWIWRTSLRFGPLAASVDTARRSLAEQVRGAGRFMLRVGSAAALHAAAVRALDEVASLEIHAYRRLSASARAVALEQATGYRSDSIAAALVATNAHRREHLLQSIELLEAARRRLLARHTRSIHGNRNEFSHPSR